MQLIISLSLIVQERYEEKAQVESVQFPRGRDPVPQEEPSGVQIPTGVPSREGKDLGAYKGYIYILTYSRKIICIAVTNNEC